MDVVSDSLFVSLPLKSNIMNTSADHRLLCGASHFFMFLQVHSCFML